MTDAARRPLAFLSCFLRFAQVIVHLSHPSSLQHVTLFLSSLVPRFATTYNHVTATGIPLLPAHPYRAMPWPLLQLQSGALYLPHSVPAWPATAIPGPDATIMDVPASVPHPTAPITHPPPPVVHALKDVNYVPLTRKMLIQTLSKLFERLYRSDRHHVRLVMRSGAVMVL